ncbi:MAG: permease prefix domain 1-containing protein [Clostridiales Family XIII bacterium]|jgi:hypothetical protein|nr:permease prefix domain 1-containing protein [Clostridiales Family XIII bacterium]
MDTKQYVDGLFLNYEETDVLSDFKEELKSNLDDRITNLTAKGMDEKAAFGKATAELGDISALADEISLQKKQEVFEDMYMGVRKYLTPKRTIVYVLGGVMICMGLIVAAITWLTTELGVATLGSAMVFCVAGVMLLTFLGFTQETASKYPMPRKRTIFYTLSVGVFTFGLFCMPLTYLSVAGAGLSTAELAAHGAIFSAGNLSLMTAVSTMIPFIVPSVALFVFLVLTEKDRRKPWAVKHANEYMRQEAAFFADPAQATRFGLVSGAIWIAAIALFIILTIHIGILYSWLAFAGAIVMQLLIQAAFMKGKKQP